MLDVGDELLLTCERAGLQELFNMIRRYKLGADVELHKRTLEMGELSLIGPDARRIAGAGELGPDEHDNLRRRSAGATSCWSRPTSALTSSATPRRPRACAARCSPTAPSR